MTSQNLIDRLVTDYRAACAELVNTFSVFLHNAIQSRFRGQDPDIVEEAVQETLIAVFMLAKTKPERLRRIPSDDKLRGWMYRIAMRRACTEYSRRFPNRPLPDGADPIAPRSDSPEEVFAWVELLQVVNGELERLRPEDRDVIRQCELKGVPLEEIARESGVSPGTIRSRHCRGMAMLRSGLRLRYPVFCLAPTPESDGTSSQSETRRETEVNP